MFPKGVLASVVRSGAQIVRTPTALAMGGGLADRGGRDESAAGGVVLRRRPLGST